MYIMLNRVWLGGCLSYLRYLENYVAFASSHELVLKQLATTRCSIRLNFIIAAPTPRSGLMSRLPAIDVLARQ